jgi:murein DD-endopeptidase MepM/ murein hydrolase activator NlpD
MANRNLQKRRLIRVLAWFAASLSLLVGLTACTPVSPAAQPLDDPTITPSATLMPSDTPVPPTQTVTPIPTATETPAPRIQVCSPLEGFTLEELPNILSNPFSPPRPGFDYPHHGVDFSYYRYGDRMSILRLPVHSVLTGSISTVNNDRFPYGNMLIIETPLDMLPAAWLDRIAIPTPVPTLAFDSPLTCPAFDPDPAWNTDQRSLYLLYAHMDLPPEFQAGDRVECGQPVGQVGNSGNSINEHLHLEVRVGPSGARFDSMGHYTIAVTDQERYNYCVWRISGLFQMLDPGDLLFSDLH